MTYQWATCRYAGPMKAGYEDREIAECISGREPVPDDVFCYPDVALWRDRVWDMLDDILTDPVKQAFRCSPPEYVVSDDLSWLNNIVLSASGGDVDMKSLLAERLRQEYGAFRAGHATRTDDLAPFYVQGLRYLRADEAEDRARALFLTPEFQHATEPLLQAAIADLDARSPSGGREGRLYFCADERSLIASHGVSGHYLIYGGEYLQCLGTRLIGRAESDRVLKSVGRPTMFVCDIPMRVIHDATLERFAGQILEILFCEIIGEQSHALGRSAGSGLSLSVDLPGEHIVGHYHPAKVSDPR